VIHTAFPITFYWIVGEFFFKQTKSSPCLFSGLRALRLTLFGAVFTQVARLSGLVLRFWSLGVSSVTASGRMNRCGNTLLMVLYTWRQTAAKHQQVIYVCFF